MFVFSLLLLLRENCFNIGKSWKNSRKERVSLQQSMCRLALQSMGYATLTAQKMCTNPCKKAHVINDALNDFVQTLLLWVSGHIGCTRSKFPWTATCMPKNVLRNWNSQNFKKMNVSASPSKKPNKLFCLKISLHFECPDDTATEQVIEDFHTFWLQSVVPRNDTRNITNFQTIGGI